MPKFHPDFEEKLIDAQDAFVWEMPEHERHERGKRWYIILAITALLLTVYAIFTSNFLFAFIIILSVIILVIAGNESPRRLLIQIGNNGLVYDGSFVGFDDLKQFAIVYQPPHVKVLYLYPKQPFQPRFRLLLGDQDPSLLRDHLLRYLNEDLDLRDEHTSDMLAKLFKL
ncbi:MAG: hypothetical protein WC477_03585 [Patescibacteria group bacterium]